MTARRAPIRPRRRRHGSGAIAGRRPLISRGVGHTQRRESTPARAAALDFGERRNSRRHSPGPSSHHARPDIASVPAAGAALAPRGPAGCGARGRAEHLADLPAARDRVGGPERCRVPVGRAARRDARGLRVGTVDERAQRCTFNYFHLPPTGQFTIADSRRWVALGAFLASRVRCPRSARRRPAMARSDHDNQSATAPTISAAPTAARRAWSVPLNPTTTVLGSWVTIENVYQAGSAAGEGATTARRRPVAKATPAVFGVSGYSSRYGTLVRMTRGSNSSSRLM